MDFYFLQSVQVNFTIGDKIIFHFSMTFLQLKAQIAVFSL
ncbi:Uncharacterised protein [Lactobacillus acidophilus]|nr:hypothetical protein HMPREF0506_1011 [Lactobacillus crispatus JV-V01]EQM96456.1 hypothetical protein HMPREF0507_02258 [Lactobacillus crispatus MV-1A-US]STX16121.1 Uncharacterised protein [Lactobacillus acidophilus]